MRTRTLLILAVVCGLFILLAGGIKLLNVADESGTVDDLRIGATAQAGDAEVTVVSATEADERMVVQVRLGGVDDPAGIDGFALIVAGGALRVVVGVDGDASDGACTRITVESQTCDLVFDTTDVQGSARVLLLRRGEDQRRWALA